VFGLFVSPVPGAHVHRYGVPGVIIGYSREPLPDQGKGKVIDIYKPGASMPVIQEGAVVALTHREVQRFRKEYLRVLKQGALIERTEEDWKAWQAQQETPTTPEVQP